MYAFVMIALGVAAVFFVFAPLWSRKPLPFDTSDDRVRELEHLTKEKQKFYSDIKDLDFEYGIGKMAEDDYHALRKEAVTGAAKILQRIDTIQTRSNGSGRITDESIENLIRSKRKVTGAAGGVVVQTDDNILVCPSCNYHNTISAKFCTECGNRLVKE